ncbi:MAG TPA: sensor histidine kinase [Telluria sp.]|nr:sensor histidine kinase [Telluria sp.]
MLSILSLPVRSELDVIAVRQRARQIATLCGFATQDQARIATTISELARNVFDSASVGEVSFSISGPGTRQTLVVVVEDRVAESMRTTGAAQPAGEERAIGIVAARRFMDACDIKARSDGTAIVLHKHLPAQAACLSRTEIDGALERLDPLPSNVALSEAHHQNRELGDALAAIQLKQAELIDLSTRLEETNRNVESLNRRLMTADRRKDEFLSMLSHELRAPLSTVSMAGTLLERGPVAPDQTLKLAGMINRQVTHMTQLVEDLIDISRISRGLVSIDRRPIDLRDVVGAAVEQTMSAALKKNHHVEVSLPESGCLISGDRTRLVQVIVNLLGNAIRYTPDYGRVLVRVAASGANVNVKVSDNGMGIPAALIPNLFDLYVQAENTSERTSGLGLGLALVKSLVELHDGSVSAESPGTGCGSTFEVTFPAYVR